MVMLKDEIIKALNGFFVKFKIPMQIKDLFLYRPVYHEPPFEDFEPINEAKKLTACDPLCIEFDYEFEGYDFSYHLECRNKKGVFGIKEMWLKYSDIYPSDASDMKVDENEMTVKSKIDVFSSMLLQVLSLAGKELS
jgi:hypothetical protein